VYCRETELTRVLFCWYSMIFLSIEHYHATELIVVCNWNNSLIKEG